MPISFSDHNNLNKQQFIETGAFDVILDLDSKFFIDPALLNNNTIEEFKGVKEKVEKYFNNIISLINASSKKDDMFWRKADKILTFKEVTGTCIGYSKKGTGGNAIGFILRQSILNTIKELINVGEKDPVIFELLGVFQENFGCDRISDLLTYILLPEILTYTQRIISTFELNNMTISINEIKYKAYKNEINNQPILLLPKVILSPLPIAESFYDIDRICMANDRIRAEINSYIDLKNRKKLYKSEIHELIINSKSFRSALISAYKSSLAEPYNFDEDPIGEYLWYEVAKKYVKEYILTLTLQPQATTNDVYEIVMKICLQFKNLIELNGLWELLYDNKKIAKYERAAQLLFFGIADSYCTANNIDLTRESNVGRGPCDFKLSKGAIEKVVVEVKLTSNGQLKHGVEIQLPIYMKQEKTNKAIYLIIDNGHPQALKNFKSFYKTLNLNVKQSIPVIIIDGTIREESASKAKS